MISCLTKHFEKIQVLNISHNRIGTRGAEKLAGVFKEMK